MVPSESQFEKEVGLPSWFSTYMLLFNFRVVYSAIYEFSHSEDGPAAYSIDQAGNVKI